MNKKIVFIYMLVIMLATPLVMATHTLAPKDSSHQSCREGTVVSLEMQEKEGVILSPSRMVSVEEISQRPGFHEAKIKFVTLRKGGLVEEFIKVVPVGYTVPAFGGERVQVCSIKGNVVILGFLDSSLSRNLIKSKAPGQQRYHFTSKELVPLTKSFPKRKIACALKKKQCESLERGETIVGKHTESNAKSLKCALGSNIKCTNVKTGKKEVVSTIQPGKTQKKLGRCIFRRDICKKLAEGTLIIPSR